MHGVETAALQQALVRFCKRPDVAYKNPEPRRPKATIAGQYNPFLGLLHRRFFDVDYVVYLQQAGEPAAGIRYDGASADGNRCAVPASRPGSR
jgi:hypothetical protein